MRDHDPKNADQIPSSASSLSDTVLGRLAEEGISPRPWWQFYAREGVVWFCWLASVVVGAAAVAVTLYVTLSVPVMLYEATHANLFTAMVHALPWVWLIVFLGMAYLAWMNLRYTRRGYRYQALTLVTSSVLLSVGLGVLLQQLGQGYVMDRTFAAWMSTYPSYEKNRLGVWQAPQEGRLVGAMVQPDGQIVIDHATGTIVFQDADGEQWRLLVPELPEHGQALLDDIEYERVRLIGTTTAPHEFYVCGAFRWVFTPEYETFSDQRTAARIAFVETATWHQNPEKESATTTRCAALPMFRRVPAVPAGAY